MPFLADFHADLDNDRITVPSEALAVLRQMGGGRFRVMIEPAMGSADELGRRGITPDVVAAVAAAQKLAPELAAVALSGEGIAARTELADRLERLARSEEASS